jgi:hypothetical protein
VVAWVTECTHSEKEQAICTFTHVHVGRYPSPFMFDTIKTPTLGERLTFLSKVFVKAFPPHAIIAISPRMKIKVKNIFFFLNYKV